MYLVSDRNTMRNAKQIVQDKPIDLNRKDRREAVAKVSREWVERERRLKELARREKERWTLLVAEAKALEEARELAEMELDALKRITIHKIMVRVCKWTGYSVQEITSPRRSHGMVLVRQAIMYWSRRRTTKTYAAIAKKLGGRDHTTVVHGVTRYVERRAKMGRTLRPLR